jgi:hypothetical protein
MQSRCAAIRFTAPGHPTEMHSRMEVAIRHRAALVAIGT